MNSSKSNRSGSGSGAGMSSWLIHDHFGSSARCSQFASYHTWHSRTPQHVWRDRIQFKLWLLERGFHEYRWCYSMINASVLKTCSILFRCLMHVMYVTDTAVCMLVSLLVLSDCHLVHKVHDLVCMGIMLSTEKSIQRAACAIILLQ